MDKAQEKIYNRRLLKWVKNHYWDSLEPNKDLILRHLKTFIGEVELITDRPEWRKILAQLQASFYHPDVTLDQIQAEWDEFPDEQYIIRDDDIEEYYKQADQILALFPDEPQCKHLVAEKTGICLHCGEQILRPKDKLPLLHADGCATNLGVIGAVCNCGAEIQWESDIKFYGGAQ